ncbi:MAG TPA: dienelactone hydrolase family protein [Candidatus Eremiobacteraceae bacterium]|nr:dienelactone hydrolase family protein [Candidatus Eremiobacteraceae bacterium]
MVCLATSASAALAQQEFPPPQGKGRVVVLSSGMSGPAHYTDVARDIAQLGYDVVLVDGNAEEGTHGAGVRTAIQEALAMPHALPGKVALVGFSLGGGESLYYGTQWGDQVAGVVVWFPANSFIRNVPGFASRLQTPVVVLAGGKDNYQNGCCTAAYDSALQAAAQAAGKSFELTIYPDADHDFVKGGANYNAKDYEDGLKRTAEALKAYFSN